MLFFSFRSYYGFFMFLLPEVYVNVTLDHAATPFTGGRFLDTRMEKFSSEGNLVAIASTILPHRCSMRSECFPCKDLQELFDKLYTLESFIVLEKPEQLFIYSRREHLPLFIEMQADDSKLSELEKLSADDQGFFKYLHSVNFGM